jgi:DNA-binding transcriptional LysR family regulator
VLAEEVAVVAEEDDAGVVERAAPLERLEQLAHALVDRGHHRRPQPDLLLRARLDPVHHLAAGRRVAQPEGLGERRLGLDRAGRVHHVGPRRERLAAVQVGVAGRRDVAAATRVERAVGGLEGVRVDRLVREEQRVRRVVATVDELERLRVQQVGHVAGVLRLDAVHVQHRVDDRAVAREADPAVVARARRGAVPHVPLADVRGPVAEPLQDPVVVRQPVAERVARDVVDHAVPARVLAGDDRGAVRRAQRRGVERVAEPGAFVADPVDVRRLHVRMTAEADLVEAQVVDQDHDQVGAAGAGAGHAGPGRVARNAEHRPCGGARKVRIPDASMRFPNAPGRRAVGVTLRQMRAFEAAARALSFTRAAQQLHVSQSAVSLQIRDLEEALGVRLFERGRRLSLTAAGAAFAQAGGQALRAVDAAVTAAREDADAAGRGLRIGVGHLLAATVFPAALADFVRRHPGVRVRIVDCPVEQLGAKVLAGEVDLAIGSLDAGRPPPELRAEPLWRDAIHVASARGDPLPPTGRRGLPWKRLQGEPMIVVNAANEVWRTLPGALAAQGAALEIAHEVALYSTGFALARRGLGRLLLPGFCARAPELKDLAIRPLVQPVVPWNVSLLQRRGASASPAARALVEGVRARLGG